MYTLLELTVVKSSMLIARQLTAMDTIAITNLHTSSNPNVYLVGLMRGQLQNDLAALSRWLFDIGLNWQPGHT